MGLTITGWPSVMSATSLPTNITSPAPSCPSAVVPAAFWLIPPTLMYDRSLPQIPQAFILMTTSFGPGCGR